MAEDYTKSVDRVTTTSAFLDVVRERVKQIRMYSFVDDKLVDFELSKAAACYLKAAAKDNQEMTEGLWPWRPVDWKPETRRENLVKAAALIIAEIERLDKQGEEGHV